MKNAKVISIHRDIEECAVCPSCDCYEWYLCTRPGGKDKNDIIAYECADCGYRVDIENAE